jgi:putative N6-adenine-specific DNA methylase
MAEQWITVELRLGPASGPEDPAEDVLGALLPELGAHGLELTEDEDGRVVAATFRQDATPEALAEAVRAACAALGDGLGVRSVEARALAEAEWAPLWQANFEPLVFGDVAVIPPWAQAPEEVAHVLSIDPSRAFGTGQHPTTALCLEALTSQRVRGRVLDVGIGSGVLALTALLRGAGEAVGVDLDPEARQAALQSAAANGLAARLQVPEHGVERVRGRFEWVLANLRAEPLLALVRPLADRVGPGGQLLLSGMRADEADAVRAAYLGRGLRLVREAERDGWVMMQFTLPHAAPVPKPRPGAEPLFVACAPGLEPHLEAEVRAVLGRAAQAVPGGVELQGDLREVYALNLHLGLATAVRVRVAQVEARHFAALRRGLDQVPWARWLRPGAPLAVRATSHHSKLLHTGGLEDRVRDAVQEGLQAEAPPPDEGADAPELVVRMHEDVCTVSLDASGAPLHRRGYRLASAKAPLREDLAHAAVRLSGWRPGQAFADPFCGAGTLGIEAARWARGIPPGWARKFACEAWPELSPAAVAEVRAAAEARLRGAAGAPLYLSDRDPGAVVATRENAARAGVEADVEVTEAALGAAPFLSAGLTAGAWVSNPPHGGRVGKQDTLRNLYQSVGQRFLRLGGGWSLTLVVRDRRLAHATGAPLSAGLMTSHGGSKIWVMRSAELDPQEQ